MFEDQSLLNRSSRREEDVAVFGLGHVGLPASLRSAESCWLTVGVGSDAGNVQSPQDGRVPFFKLGLAEYFQAEVEALCAR